MQLNGLNSNRCLAESQTETNLNALPFELHQAIFSLALKDDPKILVGLTSTCRKWRLLVLDPFFLNQLFSETLLAGNNPKDILRALVTDLRMSSQKIKPKEMQWQAYPISSNSGDLGLVYHKGFLISFSHNNAIKIWNEKTGELVKEIHIKNLFDENVNYIQSLKVIEDRLFIASDAMLAFFNLQDLLKGDTTAERVISLHKHSLLSDFKFSKNRVFVGDLEQGLRLFDMDGERVITFDLDSKGLFCLYGETIITADIVKGDVHSWDRDGRKLKTYSVNPKGITSLAIFREKLIIGSWEGLIQVFDLKMEQEVKQLKAHSRWVKELKVVNDKVISFAAEPTLCISDLEGNLLHKIASNGIIKNIDYHEGKIYAIFTNGLIKTFDFAPEK